MPWVPWGNKGKNKFTPEHLSGLCNEVIKYSGNPTVNHAMIVDTLKDMAQILVWEDQQQENESRIFDIFLERNMLPYLTELLCKRSLNPEVQTQLLQTLYILIQNIKSPTSIFYLLSGNHINKLIMFEGFDFDRDDELLSHFINFLKSLSLRLDEGTIQCFYNRETDSFPLYVATEKFLNKDLGNPLMKAATKAIVVHMCQVPDEYVLNYVIRSATYIRTLFKSIGNLHSQLDALLTPFEESVNHYLHPAALPKPFSTPVSLVVLSGAIEDVMEEYSHIDDLLTIREKTVLRHSIFEETERFATHLGSLLRSEPGTDGVIGAAVPRCVCFSLTAQWFYQMREEKIYVEMVARLLMGKDKGVDIERPKSPVKPVVKVPAGAGDVALSQTQSVDAAESDFEAATEASAVEMEDGKTTPPPAHMDPAPHLIEQETLGRDFFNPVCQLAKHFDDGWISASLDTADEDPRTPQNVIAFILAILESAEINRTDTLLAETGLLPRRKRTPPTASTMTAFQSPTPTTTTPTPAAAEEADGEASEGEIPLSDSPLPTMTEPEGAGTLPTMQGYSEVDVPEIFAEEVPEQAPPIPGRQRDEVCYDAEWAGLQQEGVDYPFLTVEMLLLYLCETVRHLDTMGRLESIEMACRVLTSLLKASADTSDSFELDAHHVTLLRDLYQVSCYNLQRRFHKIKANLSQEGMLVSREGGGGGGGGGVPPPPLSNVSLTQEDEMAVKEEKGAETRSRSPSTYYAINNNSMVFRNPSLAGNLSNAQGRSITDPTEVLFYVLSNQLDLYHSVKNQRSKKLLANETTLLPPLPLHLEEKDKVSSHNPSFAGSYQPATRSALSSGVESPSKDDVYLSPEASASFASGSVTASVSVSCSPPGSPTGRVPLPGRYRIIGASGAKVRRGEAMATKMLKRLPQGLEVDVVEVVGRRARLSRPIDGWVSLWGGDNVPILEPVDGGNTNADSSVGGVDARVPAWIQKIPLESRCPLDGRTKDEVSKVEATAFLLIRSMVFNLLKREDTIAEHLRQPPAGKYSEMLGESVSKDDLQDPVRCQVCLQPLPQLGSPPLATTDLLARTVCDFFWCCVSVDVVHYFTFTG